MIVAFAMFMLIRSLNRLKKAERSAGPDDQGLPPLLHGHSGGGDALPELHLAAVI